MSKKEVKKELPERFYRFIKPILGTIFKLYYNPKIYGKENIPKDGPILVVGNHKHIMDQCHIIISTKRVVHYMAKKEYFDNKKVAWFFKGAGCISVNRSIKDENAKSFYIFPPEYQSKFHNLIHHMFL